MHRGDDAFALMEQQHNKQKMIKLLRNIDRFAFLRRHIENRWKEELHFPVRGPRLIVPPPKALEPVTS